MPSRWEEMLSQIGRPGKMKGANWKTWLGQGKNCTCNGCVLLSGAPPIIFEIRCDKREKSTSQCHATAGGLHFPGAREDAWRACHGFSRRTEDASHPSGESIGQCH